jgi:hypothetical protein
VFDSDLTDTRHERDCDLPPDPASLIESMRAFGYSLPSAIADLVDNSITARATRIDVDLRWAGAASSISIADDGVGMDADQLTAAMRLGSTNPREHRSPGDLGRFGLGLKTAAFSQATVLTVASKVAQDVAVRRWDLAHVASQGTWSLLLDPAPSAAERIADLAGRPHGTLVLLEGLDRLSGGSYVDDERAQDHFLRHTDAVVEHLAMVFHRFIAEDRLAIAVNGRAVEPWDPFLSRSKQHVAALPAERLPLGSGVVLIQPYVLPHFSKLTPAEHNAAAGPRGWNHQQGFYVYRGRRLLVAGGWLGLGIQQEEHFKLARIRVDLDNGMDEAWQIDVRKSTARVPRQLTQELRRIADATRRRAGQAYRYRGKRLAGVRGADSAFVWGAHLRDGQVSYRVDRGHPVVEEALREAGEARGAVERLLRTVEETVPIGSIVMDSRERPDGTRSPFEGRESEVRGMLRDTFEAIVSHGGLAADALTMLAAREPFSDFPQLIAALEEEIK